MSVIVHPEGVQAIPEVNALTVGMPVLSWRVRRRQVGDRCGVFGGAWRNRVSSGGVVAYGRVGDALFSV